MATQIIKDTTGNPISVLVDYRQWLEMEQLLERTKIKADAPENPLDWYTLTETTNSILNGLMAYTSRERRKELKKEKPNAILLSDLNNLFEEIHAINDNPDNFKSARKMEEIIGKYAPKLRAIYENQ